MTAPYEPSGPNTPPFGQPTGPEFHPTQPAGDHGAPGFPAPAGVPSLGSGSGYPPAGDRYQSGTATIVQPRAAATRSNRPRGLVVATAALSAVIGAGAGIGAYSWVSGDAPGAASSPIQVTTQPAANSPVLNGTVSAAAQRIEPSVVTITVQSAQGESLGTGEVLDTDGHILTNDHVVSGAQQGAPDGESSQPGATPNLRVTFDDGTTEPATIVGTSQTNDLAVIKVAASDKLVPATFAKSASLKVGQAVVAVGAPLGLSDTVTSGIVSNTARPVRSGSTNDAVYLAVQTDAAINPGNSGGPLVNLNGDVVGINSSIASTGSGSSGEQAGNIGIGFAIPADLAVRVAGELVADGSYTNAALGVTLAGQDSPGISTEGVTLQSVSADSAAAKAGLRAGDQVIKINDFSTTTADALIAATRFYAPGTAIEVTYTRDGKTDTTKVILGSA
ncbi:MAG: trypsin-like peptidase domain-containing protein [Microlunatus sp.]|nr:trypsin-like peptidase domain-containing protein [Microlunatus sp.]MDN5771536.1 trypsin-like peptidase domain-containing protein [Microlunatus sp.]